MYEELINQKPNDQQLEKKMVKYWNYQMRKKGIFNQNVPKAMKSSHIFNSNRKKVCMIKLLKRNLLKCAHRAS